MDLTEATTNDTTKVDAMMTEAKTTGTMTMNAKTTDTKMTDAAAPGTIADPARTPRAANAGSDPILPPFRWLTLGLRRVAFELKLYFRARDQVFFTFLFPIMMYALFASIFESRGTIGGAPDGSGGVSAATYYLTGMLASAVLLSGVQTLGLHIPAERDNGTLKRLGGSPLAAMSYFIGKLGVVVITSAMQIALLFLLAIVVFGVELPSDGGRWITFAWVYLLGILSCSVLGVAISALPRSAKSAGAIVLPLVIVPQFISGVYLTFSTLPEWLQNLAQLFPVKWIAQGMRAAFLPEGFAAVEQGGSWNLGLIALILAGWCAAGVMLAGLSFRWNRKDG